jgi:hypothetical protein
MITKEDVDAMEDRVTRMFPYIDVTAVNVLRYEIQNLRKLLGKPCAVCEEIKELKELKKVEPKVKREQISKKDSVGSIEGQPEA